MFGDVASMAPMADVEAGELPFPLYWTTPAAQACDDQTAASSLLSVLMQSRSRPLRRKLVPDVIGRRHGRLLIVGSTHRWRGDGRVVRCWRVRCECGSTFTISRIRGHECKACANSRRRHAEATRYGGKTLQEIADLAGLSMQAIWQRVRKGWPVEQLALRDTRRAVTPPHLRRAA